MTDKPPKSEPGDSVFRDPFTGTTPVGPIQPAPPGDVEQPDEQRWGMAAKWFMLALLGLLLVIVIGWFYWGIEI